MPGVGFETTIPVFERAKIFHTLDGAAVVIGPSFVNSHNISEGMRIVTGRCHSTDSWLPMSYPRQPLCAVIG
jgi:hypothetical protein